MNETKIKAKVTKRLKQLGFLVIRLRSTDPTGMPDLMALKNKSVVFIETKTETGVLSGIQIKTIQNLEKCGFRVLVVSSAEMLEF
jgi:Holliday junction resolvase